MIQNFGTKFHYMHHGFDRTEVQISIAQNLSTKLQYKISPKRALQLSARFCRCVGLHDVADTVLNSMKG